MHATDSRIENRTRHIIVCASICTHPSIHITRITCMCLPPQGVRMQLGVQCVCMCFAGSMHVIVWLCVCIKLRCIMIVYRYCSRCVLAAALHDVQPVFQKSSVCTSDLDVPACRAWWHSLQLHPPKGSVICIWQTHRSFVFVTCGHRPRPGRGRYTEGTGHTLVSSPL